MKKLLFLLTLIIGFAFFNSGAKAQSPDDLIPEPTCIAYSVTSAGSTQNKCNTVCKRQCIIDGLNCPFNDPNTCTTIPLDSLVPEITGTVRPAFNIFSVELCPDASQRPPGDPYCTLIVVRMAFYAVISLLIFVLIVMALWVVWERSTAADNPEKVEKAASIAKNAMIGAIITFLFIAIVQVTSLLLGLTGNLFDITIVPQVKELKRGEVCSVNEFVKCEFGTSCVQQIPGSDIYYCL